MLAGFPSKISLHGTAKCRLHAHSLHSTKMASAVQQRARYSSCSKDFLPCVIKC